MNKIKAEIVADSLNEQGQRLTTFVCTFPRIILSELNTHRMFSRNSASSRAIPFERMAKMVESDPFIPIKWQKDHKGMQGTEYFSEFGDSGYVGYSYLTKKWLQARDEALNYARELNHEGLTKQLCNRLLEPFLWHKALITSTEWENFFALRAHDDAEIHIQELAYKMLDEYNAHSPKQLKAGEWHIPFGDKINIERIGMIPATTGIYQEDIQEYLVKIATARCARVSYLNFDGKDDYEADIKLHDRLLESGHMSPFEHCAKAMSKDDMFCWTRGEKINDHKVFLGWCGNFRGFIQYRKMLAGENKIDNRVNK